MRRLRNSDTRVRALERSARASGASSDYAAWWRELVRTGANSGDATLAVLEASRVGILRPDDLGLLVPVLENLFRSGSIGFDQVDDESVVEAFRRVAHAASDDGDTTWCDTNDCEQPSCHRCWPREGCGLHEKCRDFASRGEAPVVESDVARTALRWLILQRALNDGSSGEWGGPGLPAIPDVAEAHNDWVAWAQVDSMANADDMSRDRVNRIRALLRNAVDAAEDLVYSVALAAIRAAVALIEGAGDDEFECSRCERTSLDLGRTSCGECGERFCARCDTEGGAHGGYHSCYGRCECGEELEAGGDSDYCKACRAKRGEADDVVENPYWGRAGSGLMFFSPDRRRVLLTLRSSEVDEPGTWGIPGGAVEGRDVYRSAIRETTEELGSVPKHEVFGKVVFEDGDFKFTTFLATTDASALEWEPEFDWENDDADWFDVSDLPGDLHFGVEHIVASRPDLFAMVSDTPSRSRRPSARDRKRTDLSP